MNFGLERGKGGYDRRAGILMDVDFVRIGCGVLLSKIIRKKKAGYKGQVR
ncbi:MAG: hypothetical protein JSV56_01575 [Methanomassiliicoccales archaeon]|nr:MAG: hypothetical protein JSV56_01575 [Methanomassiliicoccales archaeon]